MKYIDLHGKRHKEVFDVIADACSKFETPFEVITGRSILMKAEVAEAVSEFGLRIRDHVHNPGRVVVYE